MQNNPSPASSVRVQVVAFASLRRFLPGLKLGEVRWMEFPPGTTLRRVMQYLEMPEEEVKVVMRNSLQVVLDDTIEEGDRIAFMPAMAGGCVNPHFSI